MQTDLTARHSPIGLFQRVSYLVHLASDGPGGSSPWNAATSTPP
jgi:hypothetical protein